MINTLTYNCFEIIALFWWAVWEVFGDGLLEIALGSLSPAQECRVFCRRRCVRQATSDPMGSSLRLGDIMEIARSKCSSGLVTR